jgi:hypothetical protein
VGLDRRYSVISAAVLSAIGSRRRSGTTGGGGVGGGDDPNFANVVALLHFNGADGATTFLDHSPGSPSRLWTANGNAQIDTAQSKFGGASGVFDGTGDYVSAGDSADWDLGSSDFTIECWARLNATGEMTFVAQVGATGANNTASFSLGIGAGTKARGFFCSGSSIVGDCVGATTLSTGQWYHIAYVRNGTSLKIYLDGNEDGSATSSATMNNSTDTLAIGRYGAFDGGYFNGWIDELRITKGVARYVGSPTNFTPPTSAFPDS